MFSAFKRPQVSSDTQQPLLNINELIDLRQLARKIACSTSLQHTLESRNIGNLPTRVLGGGIDYAESRVYQFGDDIRSINWRLSARSNETFVKTFHIESKPSLSIFLDRRRTMVFGTCKRLKIAQAVRVASLLTYASTNHQLDFKAWILDETGIQFFDNTETFLVQANQLSSLTITDSNIGISDALQEITELSAKGSLIFLLSDFSDLDKSHQAKLARLNESCFVQAMHVVDTAEQYLPTVGKLRLQNMYDNQYYSVDSYSEKERASFIQFSKQYFENIKLVIKDIGVEYKQLETDVDQLEEYVFLPLGQGN